jgi:hypothetical protein
MTVEAYLVAVLTGLDSVAQLAAWLLKQKRELKK